MAEFRIQIVLDPTNADRGTRRVRASLARTEAQADQLGSALRQALSFAAIAQGVRTVVGLTDSFTNLQNRLRTVTTGTQELADVTDALFAISQRTRGSFEATAELYARVGLASRELGLTTQDTLQFTESLNQAVILSGASAQEATAGLIQLSQGLASGTLRGDELRSVLEQLPVVSDVIAQSLNITRGQLRELGEQGRITADQVITAFQEAREELAERFQETVPTIGQGFLLLRNSAILLAGEFDAATGASRAFAGALIGLAANLDVAARGVGVLSTAVGTTLALRAIPVAIGAVSALNAVIAANPLGALAVALTTVTSAIVFFGQSIPAVSAATEELQDLVAGVFAGIPETVDNVSAFLDQRLVPAFIDAFIAISDAVEDFVQFLSTTILFGEVFEGLATIQTEFQAFGVTAARVFNDLRPLLGSIATDLVRRFRFVLSGLEALFDNIFEDFELSFQGLLRVAARTADTLLGVFLGLARGVPVVFENFPAAIELLFVEAANLAQAPFATLFNFITGGLNELFRRAGLDELDLPSFPVLEASQEAEELGGRIADALATGLRDSTAFNDSLDAILEGLNQVREEAEERPEDPTRRPAGPTDFDQLLQGLRDENDLLLINDALRRQQSATILQAIEDLGALTEAQEIAIEAEVARGFAIDAQREAFDNLRGPLIELTRQQEALTALFENGIITLQEYRAALRDIALEAGSLNNSLSGGLLNGLLRIADEADSFGRRISDAVVGAFNGLTDVFVDFVTTGEAEIRDFANAVIADLLRIASQQVVAELLGGLLGAGLAGATPAGLAGPLFQGLPGFQTGGSFMVGGSGGPDSQLVAFRASPTERVTVETPAQQRQGPTMVRAPDVNLNVVNQLDSSEVVRAGLDSPEGRRVLINVIRDNAEAIRRVTQG